jgi:transposase-like protein
MFGRRKYNRGPTVKGQWVFGGVERESGRTFLVPVPDRTADTLMTVIDTWIEPGTTVISNCWAAYRNLDAQGYTHRTVNHTISFVSEGGITPTPLSPSGVTSRRTWNPTRGRTTTFTTSHTTCSRQGAKLKESNSLRNFYTLPRARTSHRVLPPLHKASRRDSLLLWSPVIWHRHSQVFTHVHSSHPSAVWFPPSFHSFRTSTENT